MLVASATLGLLAPIAAQASNVVNLEEMNSYSRSKKANPVKFDSKTFINNVIDETANLKGSKDSLEFNNLKFEAGSFSDTTTFDGKAVMAIGAVDGADNLGSNGHEKVVAATVYQVNLNTSFTGDDNLYVRLKGGDGWDGAFDQKTSTYHIEAKDTSNGDDTLFNVDKIWYTFPVGDNFTATVGPKIENYYMLAATPSVYKPGALKAFKLGGNGAAFGASTSVGAGIKYVADNGFAVSTTVNSKGADGTSGFLTKEDQNKINTQVAYTADNYHASVTYSRQKGWNSWSYFATKDLYTNADSTTVNSDSYALRAWWRPEETGSLPSISVGYDFMNFDGRTSDNIAEGSGYFVGLNWADMFQPDDKIGLAVGQPMKATKATAGNTLSEVDPFLWELYYSFRPNDSIEITPAIFGGTDVEDTTADDIFGAVLTTTFKF